MKRTVLITGIAGFLGRYMARQFFQEGWSVIGLDDVPPENVQLPGTVYHRMQLPSPELRVLLGAAQPDVCVHCAGRASVGLSMEDPAADFRGNTILTFEILEALRLSAPTCQFLLLSSAAVYGNPESLPILETHAAAPLSPYGYHKRSAELLCEEFSRIYGLRTACVRIFSAYGPGLRRQVVWDMCEKVLTAGQLLLRGTGAESRDFIHAADIARGLLVLVSKAASHGEVYNLASGQETEIGGLARLVLEALGSSLPPQFDGTATPGNPLRWQADITRIQDLGFTPSISLHQGIRSVAAWCVAELGPTNQPRIL